MPFTDYPNYMGLPILMLAAVAVALRRDRWSWMLVTIIVLSTLVALGRHGPLYRIFYEVLPGFSKFRVPVMILILQQYSLVLLAAAGMDALAKTVVKPKQERPTWLGLPLLVAVAATGLILLLVGTELAETLGLSANR